MADEIIKKVLIQVEAKTETLKQNVGELNLVLDSLIAKRKAMGKQTVENSKEFVDNATQTRLVRDEIRNKNREIDNSVKALTAENNSIVQNRALLASLTAEHIKLTQVEGEGSKKAVEMEKVVNKLSGTLKAQEKAMGDNRREVGNYGLATENLKGKISDLTSVNSVSEDVSRKVIVGFQTAKMKMNEAKATFTDFKNSVVAYVGALKDSKEVQKELTLITNAATAANERATLIGYKFSQGQATAAEAESANAVALALTTSQTEAQTAATNINTISTNAGTTAMRIFKIALLNTGIGAIVVALGALVTYFTSTNEGANKFKVITGALSAVMQQLVKFITPIGGMIADIFSDKNNSAVKVITASIQNFIIPIKTIISALWDLAHGDFKGALHDISDGFKEMAVNMTEGFSAGKELVKTISKSAVKAGKEIASVGANFKNAALEGAAIAKDMQRIAFAEREWSTAKIRQQNEVDLLTAKIRQQTTSEEERIEFAKEAKKIRKDIFEKDVYYAKRREILTNREQALNSKKDKQAIQDAKNKVLEVSGAYELQTQMIENKESKLQMKLKRSSESQKSIDAKNHEDVMKYIAEEENEKIASLSRQAQTLLDAYGKELASVDEQYRQLINKQNNYLIQHAKQLENEPEAKKKINEYIIQLKNEKHAKILELADKFEKDDNAKLDKIQKELTQLAISGMRNATEIELAQLNVATQEKLAQIERENQAVNDILTKQQANIILLKKDGKDEEAAILQKSVDNEIKVLELSGKAKAEFLAQQAKKEQEIKDGKGFSNSIKEVDSEIENAVDERNIDHEFDARQKKLDIEHKQAVTAALAKNEAIKKIDQDYARSTRQLDVAKLTAEKDLQLKRVAALNGMVNSLAGLFKKQSLAAKAAFLVEKALTATSIILSTQKAIALNRAANAGIPLIGFAKAQIENLIILTQGAANLAIVAAQKPGFATGGVYKSDGKGGALSGYSKTDNINSQLRSGEGILVSEAMQVPWARNIASALNVAFGGRDFSTSHKGGGFAIGGIYTDGGNSNRYYSQPVIDTKNLGDALANQIINNFPPIIADIKDIIGQSGILVQTKNRSTF